MISPTNNDGPPSLMDQERETFGKLCRKLHRDSLIDGKIYFSESIYRNTFHDIQTREKTRCAETLAIDILAAAIVRGTIRKERG